MFDLLSLSVCYLLLTGFVLAVILGVFIVGLALVRSFYPSLAFGRSILRMFIFCIWLLLFSTLGEIAWVYLTVGHLYDNPDLLVDWLPYRPPGRWTLDEMCGGHLLPGTTWFQMYLYWFGIAVPVWILTITFYRWTRPSPIKTVGVKDKSAPIADSMNHSLSSLGFTMQTKKQNLVRVSAATVLLYFAVFTAMCWFLDFAGLGKQGCQQRYWLFRDAGNITAILAVIASSVLWRPRRGLAVGGLISCILWLIWTALPRL